MSKNPKNHILAVQKMKKIFLSTTLTRPGGKCLEAFTETLTTVEQKKSTGTFFIFRILSKNPQKSEFALVNQKLAQKGVVFSPNKFQNQIPHKISHESHSC